jgi:hypothetical protein
MGKDFAKPGNSYATGQTIFEEADKRKVYRLGMAFAAQISANGRPHTPSVWCLVARTQ